METEIKNKSWELAKQFVNCKMNCDTHHNPTVLLRLLGPKHNDITSLRNEFIEQKERLDKKGGAYEFGHWYTADIVKILDELIEEVGKRKPTPHETNEMVGAFIVTALKEGAMFRGFNWYNYEKLVAEDLHSLFNEFDSDFRGDILTCHKVGGEYILGGKYVVIETEQYPFGSKKQKYKTREPKEKKFYSTEYRKDRLFTTSTVFNTFEAALFHTMAPSQYSAMNILFEAAKKEE